jgi:hypothetical protein
MGYGYTVCTLFILLFVSVFIHFKIAFKINLSISFIPESTRWLITKKQHEKAQIILEKIAKVNKTKLNVETWSSFLDKEKVKKNKLRNKF